MAILKKVLLFQFLTDYPISKPMPCTDSSRAERKTFHFVIVLIFPTCTKVTRSTINAIQDCSSKAILATTAIVPMATSAADDTRMVAKKYEPKVTQRTAIKILNVWKNKYILFTTLLCI